MPCLDRDDASKPLNVRETRNIQLEWLRLFAPYTYKQLRMIAYSIGLINVRIIIGKFNIVFLRYVYPFPFFSFQKVVNLTVFKLGKRIKKFYDAH